MSTTDNTFRRSAAAGAERRRHSPRWPGLALSSCDRLRLSPSHDKYPKSVSSKDR